MGKRIDMFAILLLSGMLLSCSDEIAAPTFPPYQTPSPASVRAIGKHYRQVGGITITGCYSPAYNENLYFRCDSILEMVTAAKEELCFGYSATRDEVRHLDIVHIPDIGVPLARSTTWHIEQVFVSYGFYGGSSEWSATVWESSSSGRVKRASYSLVKADTYGN